MTLRSECCTAAAKAGPEEKTSVPACGLWNIFFAADDFPFTKQFFGAGTATAGVFLLVGNTLHLPKSLSRRQKGKNGPSSPRAKRVWHLSEMGIHTMSVLFLVRRFNFFSAEGIFKDQRISESKETDPFFPESEEMQRKNRRFSECRAFLPQQTPLL